MNTQEIAAALKRLARPLTGRMNKDLDYLRSEIEVNRDKPEVYTALSFLVHQTEAWHNGAGCDSCTYFGHITMECQAYLGWLIWDALNS